MSAKESLYGYEARIKVAVELASKKKAALERSKQIREDRLNGKITRTISKKPSKRASAGEDNLAWLSKPFPTHIKLSEELKALNERVEQSYNKVLDDKLRDWQFILKEIENNRKRSKPASRIGVSTLSDDDFRSLALRMKVSIALLRDYEIYGESRTKEEREQSYFSAFQRLWPIVSRSEEILPPLIQKKLVIGSTTELGLINHSFSITFYFYFVDAISRYNDLDDDSVVDKKDRPLKPFSIDLGGVIVPAPTVADGNLWFHFAVSYGKSSRVQRVFIDGVLEGMEADVVPLQSSHDISISSEHMMRICNLQVWPSCLSEEAIRETMKVPWNARNSNPILATIEDIPIPDVRSLAEQFNFTLDPPNDDPLMLLDVINENERDVIPEQLVQAVSSELGSIPLELRPLDRAYFMNSVPIEIGRTDQLGWTDNSFSITFYVSGINSTKVGLEKLNIMVLDDETTGGEMRTAIDVSIQNHMISFQLGESCLSKRNSIYFSAKRKTYYHIGKGGSGARRRMVPLDGTWLHVGVTYDKSTGKQSIHLNGVLEEYQSGVTPLEGSRKIYITASDGVELSNLQLWPSCLSEVAIRETMKVPWNAKASNSVLSMIEDVPIPAYRSLVVSQSESYNIPKKLQESLAGRFPYEMQPLTKSQFKKPVSISVGSLDQLGMSDNSFSITFYFQSDKSIGLNNILGVVADAEGQSAVKVFVRDDRLRFDLGATSLNGHRRIEGKIWYHVACTYSKPLMEQKIYVDGVLDASSSGVFPLEGSSELFICFPSDASSADSFWLNGKICNLQVWPSCLSEEMIRETMKLPWNAIESNVLLSGIKDVPIPMTRPVHKNTLVFDARPPVMASYIPQVKHTLNEHFKKFDEEHFRNFVSAHNRNVLKMQSLIDEDLNNNYEDEEGSDFRWDSQASSNFDRMLKICPSFREPKRKPYKGPAEILPVTEAIDKANKKFNRDPNNIVLPKRLKKLLEKLETKHPRFVSQQKHLISFFDAYRKNEKALQSLLDASADLAPATKRISTSRYRALLECDFRTRASLFVAQLVERFISFAFAKCRRMSDQGMLFTDSDEMIFAAYRGIRTYEGRPIDKNWVVNGASIDYSQALSLGFLDNPIDACSLIVWACHYSGLGRKWNYYYGDEVVVSIDFKNRTVSVHCSRWGVSLMETFPLPGELYSESAPLLRLQLVPINIEDRKQLKDAADLNHLIWKYFPLRSIEYRSVFSKMYTKLKLDIDQSIAFNANDFLSPRFGVKRVTTNQSAYALPQTDTALEILRFDRIHGIAGWFSCTGLTRANRCKVSLNMGFDYVLAFPVWRISNSITAKLADAFKHCKALRRPMICSAYRTWLPKQSVHVDDFEAAAHCIYYNQYEMFHEIISKNNGLISAQSSFGDNLLLIACELNNYSIICSLINTYGSVVNCCKRNGSTPLHAAARHGNSDVVQVLISHGARQVPDRTGELPSLSFLKKHKPFVMEDIDQNSSILALLAEATGVQENEIISNFIDFLSQTKSPMTSKLIRSRWVRLMVRLLKKGNEIKWPSKFSLNAFGALLLARHFSTIVDLQPIVVNIPNNAIGDLGAIVIGKYLLSRNKVVELVLNYNDISDIGLVALLSEIPQDCDLQRLLLQGNTISDVCAKLLAEVISTKCYLSLSELNVSDTKLSDVGLLALLAAIKLNKSIKVLNFGINALNHQVIDGITTLLAQDSSINTLYLAKLILHPNNYMEEFKALFIAVAKNTRLTHLDISSSALTPEHMIIIADAIRINNVLKILDLSNCNISASGSSLIAQAIADNQACALEDVPGIQLSMKECLSILNLDKVFKKKSNSNILKFLKARKWEGLEEVHRIRLVFAGNGASGKTTLIRRLKHGAFDDSILLTDGVDISSLTLNDIEMTVFDFAGQPEYEHTHTLFFDESALFILLHNPRSAASNWRQVVQVFLNMILNCAPTADVILVTTRADEAVLSIDEIDEIKAMCPNDNIKHCIPVDSKSGTGISQLIKALVDVASKNPNTTTQIPRSFERLRRELSSIEKDIFSIPVEKIGVMYPWWPTDMTALALELFKNWGYIHRLSNGDIVLHPQQLADVMKCIFTKVEATKRRIGEVQEGILKHSNECLDAVWGGSFSNLDKSMWRCPSPGSISPFVALLYRAGLAFELYDTKGDSISASLVPALLYSQPCGFDRLPTALSFEEKMETLFIPKELSKSKHAKLSIIFTNPLPGAFMGKLQVSLRRLATLGGSWRHGCCLVIKKVKVDTDATLSPRGSNPTNKNRADARKTRIDEERDRSVDLIKSLVVMYEKSTTDNRLEFISAGASTQARTAAINAILNLIRATFPSVKVKDLELAPHKGRQYHTDDIIESMEEGFIEHKATHEKLPIQSLRLLIAVAFPDRATFKLENEVLEREDDIGDSEETVLDTTETRTTSAVIPDTFSRLQKDVEMTEKELLISEECDMVNLSNDLLSCIPDVLKLLGLRYHKKRGLSTLWVACACLEKGRKNTYVVVPISPTSIEGNENCPEGKQLLEQTNELDSRYYCAALIERALNTLGTPLINLKIVPFLPLSDLLGQLKNQQLRLFEECDNIMIKREFASKAREMIISKQIKKVEDKDSEFRTQVQHKLHAQERLARKIAQEQDKIEKAQQNQKAVASEQTEMLKIIIKQGEEHKKQLDRVENIAVSITQRMKLGFADIGKQLAGNEDALDELKDIWMDKMARLEKCLLDVGDKAVKSIRSEMDKLEHKLEASLFNNNIPVDDLKAQLTEIKQQLIEATIARQNGDANAEQRARDIMVELKGMHKQLDHLEEMTVQICSSLKNSFKEIQSGLSNNEEGVKLLRETWIKKVNDLERFMINSSENHKEDFEREFHKLELKIMSTLEDDCEADPGTLGAINAQLAEVKQQLVEAAVARQNGEAQAEKRTQDIMAELKGVHAQLLQVVQLAEEIKFDMDKGFQILRKTMQNLATRTAPTTFILVAHKTKTETAMTRMQTLYSCLKNPVSNLKDAIISQLRDKEYIALVCEVCRNPVSKDYYYEISNPKEFVGKILPLANAGLKFVCILNTVAQLATCLGVPSLDPSMLDEAQSFLDIIGSNTFDDYQSVQENVRQAHIGTKGEGKAQVSRASDTSEYCVREFQYWLGIVDKKNVWGQLTPKVDNRNGDVIFACQQCCASNLTSNSLGQTA